MLGLRFQHVNLEWRRHNSTNNTLSKLSHYYRNDPTTAYLQGWLCCSRRGNGPLVLWRSQVTVRLAFHQSTVGNYDNDPTHKNVCPVVWMSSWPLASLTAWRSHNLSSQNKCMIKMVIFSTNSAWIGADIDDREKKWRLNILCEVLIGFTFQHKKIHD